jgi:hypothetical protein
MCNSVTEVKPTDWWIYTSSPVVLMKLSDLVSILLPPLRMTCCREGGPLRLYGRQECEHRFEDACSLERVGKRM